MKCPRWVVAHISPPNPSSSQGAGTCFGEVLCRQEPRLRTFVHPEWHVSPTEATNLQGSLMPRLGAGLLGCCHQMHWLMLSEHHALPCACCQLPIHPLPGAQPAPQKPDALRRSSAAESQAIGVAGYSEPLCPAPVRFYPR